MDKSTRRLAAFGISDIDGNGTPWPQSAYIYRLRFTSWESSLECATEIRSQTGRHNGRFWFCGECSCPLLFKLTFILGTIVQRIFIPSKNSPSEHWNSHSMWLRSGSGITEKTQVFPWSIGSSLRGKGQLCWITRQFSLRLQETYLLSDSVSCMGGLSSNPVKTWKEKIDWFVNSRQYWELDRIDGEPMKVERKTFPGFTPLRILAEIQNMMSEIRCEPEHFPGTNYLHVNV